MRIGFFAPKSGVQSGITGYSLSLGRALENRGLQVISPPESILTSHEPTPIAELFDFCHAVDVLHFEIGPGRLREFCFLRALQDSRISPPSSATIHYPERIIWNPAASSISKRLPVLLQRAHRFIANRGTYHVERRTLHRTDAVIVLTHTGRECLKRNFSLNENRVHYLPHGVTIFPYQALPDFSCIRFICFGRLQRANGLEDVLWAIHHWTRAHPEIRHRMHFTLCGLGFTEPINCRNNDFAEELRFLIGELGIQDLVRLRIDLAESEIAPLIQSHHLMLLPDRESSKLKLLDRQVGASSALAWSLGCGRGVIGSSAGSLPEEITNGIGEVYPQGSVRALASSLDHILDRTDLIAAWGADAYRLGQERRWANVAEGYEILFKGIEGANYSK